MSPEFFVLLTKQHTREIPKTCDSKCSKTHILTNEHNNRKLPSQCIVRLDLNNGLKLYIDMIMRHESERKLFCCVSVTSVYDEFCCLFSIRFFYFCLLFCTHLYCILFCVHHRARYRSSVLVKYMRPLRFFQNTSQRIFGWKNFYFLNNCDF